MRIGSFIILLFIASVYSHADTIDHYMNIANNITQMEMKADPQAQAWARSARTVLMLTCESIAETLMLSNETATQAGKPLFCLPVSVQLSSAMLNEVIQQTYKEISSERSSHGQMTVSQVALLGVKKHYPCNGAKANQSVGLERFLADRK
jgi:hypothetical protein